MEIIICCFCSLVCFLAGASVARGTTNCDEGRFRGKTAEPEDELTQDIASLLRYDAGKQEEDTLE